MKTHVLKIAQLSLTAAVFALGGASAIDRPLSDARLDRKIGEAMGRLDALQAKPEMQIPDRILREARGIVILRQLKVGLGVGAEAGGGVALVKSPGTEIWSPPAFVRSAEGSWGAQIGAQDIDMFVVLMSEKSIGFLSPLGATEAGFEARAVAGPAEFGAEVSTDTLKSDVLIYTDTGGAFAGATFKAGTIVGAPLRNKRYYGANMQDILFGGKGAMSLAARKLISSIERYARRAVDLEPAKASGK